MVFTTSVVRQNYPIFVIRSNFIQALLISCRLILRKLIYKAAENVFLKKLSL